MQILHFFNTPPGLAEEQLLQLFNEKEVPPTAVRMFPLKTERSSSGLIEFSNVAEAVLAIMKCNHIPIESKGMSEYPRHNNIRPVPREEYTNPISCPHSAPRHQVPVHHEAVLLVVQEHEQRMEQRDQRDHGRRRAPQLT